MLCSAHNYVIMIMVVATMAGLTLFLVFPRRTGATIGLVIEAIVLVIFAIVDEGESWVPIFCLTIVVVMVRNLPVNYRCSPSFDLCCFCVVESNLLDYYYGYQVTYFEAMLL